MLNGCEGIYENVADRWLLDGEDDTKTGSL